MGLLTIGIVLGWPSTLRVTMCLKIIDGNLGGIGSLKPEAEGSMGHELGAASGHDAPGPPKMIGV